MTNDGKNTQPIPLATVFINPGTNQLILNVSDNVTDPVAFCLSAIQLLAMAAEQSKHKKAKQKVLRAPPGARVQ